MYQWAHVVQTHFVQVSTVIICVIKQFLIRLHSRNYFSRIDLIKSVLVDKGELLREPQVLEGTTHGQRLGTLSSIGNQLPL